MVLTLTSVSDATIARVLTDPPMVWQVIAPDDPEAYERARRDEADRAKPGLFARLFGARPEPPPASLPTPLSLTGGEGETVDIDKAWHGMHYLLTGSADEGNPPLDFLVGGGTYVGDEDVGYGPARVFTSAETREIARALAAVSDDELRARFNPEAMTRADIYPDPIWMRDPKDDDALGYVMAYVPVVRETLTKITSRRHGLMVCLT